MKMTYCSHYYLSGTTWPKTLLYKSPISVSKYILADNVQCQMLLWENDKKTNWTAFIRREKLAVSTSFVWNLHRSIHETLPNLFLELKVYMSTLIRSDLKNVTKYSMGAPPSYVYTNREDYKACISMYHRNKIPTLFLCKGITLLCQQSLFSQCVCVVCLSNKSLIKKKIK